MKIFKALLSLVISIGLVLVLNMKMGDIPPLGKFLDPFRGFWSNAEPVKYSKEDDFSIPGLKDEVTVKFDQNRIPHIFARNNHDLYFTQGYVTARDRLWQLDFQTRFAQGRLSEVVGPKAIELDRYQRRMGMEFGAENMVKEMMSDPKMKEVVDAYTAGVNAYIDQLSPADYPIEFKILDYKPEKWKPLNCGLLLKLMSATLASGSDEFYMTNVLKKYGPDVVKDLFPDYPFREDPIIPDDTSWDFKTLPIPIAPKTGDLTAMNIRTKQKEEGIGSNNWAVAGSKSATGFPILANDPHLDLTLPAIWYQIQLVSDDVNSYGVSIPGAPGIVIGFNKDIAWGVTNVGADVLDWYKIKFKDNSHSEYWYDNKWNKVTQRVENISVRGGKTLSDTVYYTHHGPVVYLEKSKPKAFSKANNIPEGYALKWVAHQQSNDIKTFYLLNRAKNYADYRNALTYYTAPAQNFAFADAENNIAITPNGYFPLKWRDQGKFLLDGSDPANDWKGRIPADQNPTVKNPARGFISSANQFSTATSYPYYINWEFSGYERGHRINNRLKVMTAANADSMRNLQNDNYSMLAENILQVLVDSVNLESLDASDKEGFEIVRKWNKFFNADEIGASIFEIWQKNLGTQIWEDEFSSPDMPMRYPSRDRTVELLINDRNSKWFDNVNTPAKETMSDNVTKAFRFAMDSLQKKQGLMSDKWRWGNVKNSNVPHLARIAGFGSKKIYNGGSKTSVNALSESNGPSWRMVIMLGKNVKGYGVFPGGQSGNPGSQFYDNMIDTWGNGKLNELLYLRSATEQPDKIITSWKLTSKK